MRVTWPESMSTFLAAVWDRPRFSQAGHHVGPNGDPYGNYVFLFRLVGWFEYFALIFHFRGFGIAVGTHACYNVMVSRWRPRKHGLVGQAACLSQPGHGQASCLSYGGVHQWFQSHPNDFFSS